MGYRNHPEYGDYVLNYFRGTRRFRELEEFHNREHDRYGNPDLVGYKVLVRYSDNYWRSPARPYAIWKNYRLVSDYKPAAYNQYGIYVVRRPEYAEEYMQIPNARMFLVGMKPRIIEHEYGYRAQEAYMIMEIAI